MTAKDLKASILQLAIQGKLVPQDPNDEPASALLARITAARTVDATSSSRQKKKSSTKSLPPITDEEKPFAIPEGWAWVRLGEISENVGARENQILAKEIKKVGAIPVVSQGQSYIDGYCDDLSKAITDVPVVMFGDHTKNVKYIDFPFVIGADGTKFFKSQVDTKWLYYWTLFQSTQIGDRGYGRHWGLLNKQIVALPPLAEQKRIVAKIEELMPMVERYGAVKEQSDALEAALPDAFRKSVLQYAIQGKLVPQDPNDEPALTLLERIAAARNAVTPRKGRARTPAAPQPIPEDEQPFGLPEGWAWCRFSDVVDFELQLVPVIDYQDMPHIAPDSIEKGTGKLLEYRTIREDKVISPKHLFKQGHILYSKIRPLLRKTIIAPFAGLCSADMYPLSTCMDVNYALTILLSDFFNNQVAEIASSRVKMPKINQDELSRTIIPLPPLAEQKRIVAEVERLLAMGEHLKVAS